MKTILLVLLMANAASAAVLETPTRLRTEDGLELKGAWTDPVEQTPRGVLVILPGSGNVGMDGDVSSPIAGKGFRNQPALLSRQIAETLARAGIASLRYDKRGFENANELGHQTMPYLLKDAKAALALAQGRYPGLKAGFVGFSEGANLALWASTEMPVAALFLLGAPARHIDTAFEYQFVTWPTTVVSRLDADRDGKITWDEMSALGDGGKLPTLGMDASGLPWKDVFAKVDTNGDRALSIETELEPMYRANFNFVMQIIPSLPGFGDWFKAYREIPNFDALAAKLDVPAYLYQAKEDSQTAWQWIVSSSASFKNGAALRLYEGLGHCFAPLEGAVGEIKTSGPIASDVLDALEIDARAAFSPAK